MLDFEIEKETHLNKPNEEHDSSEAEGLVNHKKYPNPHEGRER